MWRVVGGDVVDVTGVIWDGIWFRWIQVVFMASVPFLSAGHGWIWFPSVPVGIWV